ncbi:polysaccharide deacetylase family protein [Pelobium sp.]|nr:polysaccharide deacetylase family protein [Pelobium sp.]MDA9554682.1 polysaccharide deacetylase family protein [Pelobium sp.]
MALLIFTSGLNNRKRFAFEHIFENILGVEFAFCNDESTFLKHDGPKISYGNRVNHDDLFFAQHSIMLSKEIAQQKLDFTYFLEDKVPFAVSNSALPFDVFATTFYFLSRYEEYIIKERDQHQRFEGKNSLAFKLGFLNRPIIDEWALAIADIIKNRYPEFTIFPRKFLFVPTLDIDRPYYYKTDSLFKKLVKQILNRFKPDPFDVYDQVKEWDDKYRLNTIYFLLVGSQHQYDSAPSLSNPYFVKIIQKLVQGHQIGIHPSYFSSNQANIVKQEKEELGNIAQTEISISRQHYLLLNFPQTYRDLISAGIQEDYTLAFADVAGFRASTCTPFFWYDLEKEEITSLYVHLTAVMDQTLRKYMNLTPIAASLLIEELIENVKIVNGTFVSLWHNESVNDFGGWKGWKDVYVQMLQKGAEK